MKTIQAKVFTGKVLIDTVPVVVPETMDEVLEHFKPEAVVGVIVEALVTKARNNRRQDVTKKTLANPRVQALMEEVRQEEIAAQAVASAQVDALEDVAQTDAE